VGIAVRAVGTLAAVGLTGSFNPVAGVATAMAEGDSFRNALVGAVVTGLVAWVVPLAPIVGGTVAGYLEGGDRTDGILVGIYSGLISLVVATAMGAAAVYAIASVLELLEIPALGAALGFLFVVFAVGWALYLVVLSAFGGWVGNYVRYETEYEF
jgi:hypothetical protein